MSDCYCAKCGEPYDSYGITYCVGEGDLDPYQAKRFKKGEGCPSCDWGTICPDCQGSGKQYDSGDSQCSLCFGKCYLFTWRADDPQNYFGLHWNVGYSPNIAVLETPQFVGTWKKREPHRDGWATTRKAYCPKCQGEVCEKCGGSGAYADWAKHVDQDRLLMNGLESLLDNSDEEPIGLIDEFLGG